MGKISGKTNLYLQSEYWRHNSKGMGGQHNVLSDEDFLSVVSE
jgi:hypothetical protein